MSEAIAPEIMKHSKLMAALLVVLLTVSVLSMPYPAFAASDNEGVIQPGSAARSTGFTDVQSSDWFYSDVGYMVENSLMYGTSSTQFSPNKAITRGMIVTILWRIAGTPDVNSEFGNQNSEFKDVDAGTWYTDAVKWAASNGIVSGYGDGTFGPNDNITREQFAMMLYRYEHVSGRIPVSVADYPAFADGDKISGYATFSVNALVRQGIINGKAGNLFDPQGMATRAESAAMLARFLTAAPAFDLTDAAIYNSDGLQIALPNAYLDKLIIDAEPVTNYDGSVVLITVTEKQSAEAAIKDTGSADGMGWLFSIVRYDPAQYQATIGLDNSGMTFFAKDDNYYYCYVTASDVRLYREGGELTADAMAEWQLLNDMGTVVRSDIVTRNDLTPL